MVKYTDHVVDILNLTPIIMDLENKENLENYTKNITIVMKPTVYMTDKTKVIIMYELKTIDVESYEGMLETRSYKAKLSKWEPIEQEYIQYDCKLAKAKVMFNIRQREKWIK